MATFVACGSSIIHARSVVLQIRSDPAEQLGVEGKSLPVKLL